MLTKEQWRKDYLRHGSEVTVWGEKQYDGIAHAVDCGDLLLIPVCQADWPPMWLETCAAHMAAWRSEARDAYPNDPPHVSVPSVALWLALHYLPLPRLLWMIYPAGDLSEPVGHLGFRLDREKWPVCELDGILGNPAKRGSGLMSSAFRHITDLVQPDTWVVFPKPGNEAAKRFYSRLGFVPDTEGWNRYAGTCERWVWHDPQRDQNGAQRASGALPGLVGDMLEGVWTDHKNGDERCPACWPHYPVKCACGGLVHAEYGDDTDNGYWLAKHCDKCGLDAKEEC